MKKLNINYELTINPQYYGLIPLVANMQGCSDKEYESFLQEKLKDLVKNEIQAMIRQSLNMYYGLSQAALIEKAMIDYVESAKLSSSFTEEK